MAQRRLGAEERALWARVIAGVRPLRVAPAELPAPVAAAPAPPTPPAEPKPQRRIGRVPPPRVMPPARPLRVAAASATLDGGWDRRLRKGAVAPDRIVDLHGYTLADAHAAIDAELGAAVAAGDRVLVVVAGRERSEGPRGGIRRALSDWLAVSRHAARIAAVRPAHPRHGGGGAVYVILRR